MPNVPPNAKTPLKEMSPNKLESISGNVKERLKEKRNGVKTFKRGAIMSGVGFKPTPPFGDQNTPYHSDDKGISP